MSESKRVVPQSLEFPDSLGPATKKEKKREKGKQLAPSYRFTIALPESNDNVYSEFNYAELVNSEKKRRKAENTTNGVGAFGEDDEDDHDMFMGKRIFKNGTTKTGRKRYKIDDEIDLGAGYDENDSFIDNTDAYDEIVPVEMTTAYGGFYINSGPLEFRPAENDIPVQNCLNNINNNNNEDENSEDNIENLDDDEEDEGNHISKRLEKRIISSSEEEEEEEITGDPPRKKYKSEENGDKKLNNDNINKKKRKLQSEPSNQQSGEDGETGNMRKNSTEDKREILDLECSSEDQEERKKAKYETTKIKATGEKKKFDIKRFEKKSTSNGLDFKKIDPKKFAGKDSNIDDAIESVVNAGRADDESSRDTMDSGKSRGLGTESDCDDMDKEETPLPDSLPDDIKDTINKIKTHVEIIKDAKGKLFDEFVNTTLLTLDEKLRMINSPSARLLTYGHLARFLRCSKGTLINRTKKLHIQDVEKRVKVPLDRLKVIIDDMMPSLKEKYKQECERVAEEKNPEGSAADGESSDAEALEKSKIPRRKFPWSTETKKLVYEIACLRRRYFKIRKPKKESIETFIATFMETKVLTLWPKHWMRLQTLLKYSNLEPVEKRKPKKLRDTSVPNSVNTATVTNSMTILPISDAIVGNSLPKAIQDREKSPALLGQSVLENPVNFSMTAQRVKAIDTAGMDKKSSSNVKQREKTNESSVPIDSHENASSASNQSMAKITAVPTSQLMAQKVVKSITEKFNPINLTSGSLSITPVNDYQKPLKLQTETKKDVISITPYNEPTSIVNINDSVVISPSLVPLPPSRPDVVSYSLPNSCATVKPVPQKYRLPENPESKSDKRTDERSDHEKTDKKEKKRDRWSDEKHKSHESKKRKKDQKFSESSGHHHHQQQPAVVKSCEITTIVTPQPSLSKEEQEQRQIEETVAATNFLSRIINDDSPRPPPEIRKDPSLVTEDPVQSVQQASEHDKDIQMVMRSLKELQELQEMKYSPSHSPVGDPQKPSKSSQQYAGYQDDYHRLYVQQEGAQD